MAFESFEKAVKTRNYGTFFPDGGKPTLEDKDITNGQLARIATAIESMSRPFRDLVEQSERDREEIRRLKASAQALEWHARSLRGALTKAKKRAAAK
jgi:hypothetical protein